MDCRNASSSYSPDNFVTAFHSIPHFDINLKEVSSDFAVSLSYFEPIIIWACIPILVCLCIFILLSVYFICVCCCCCCREKKPRSKASNLSCAFLICILCLFCLGVIGAIFYAEVSLNRNIDSFINNGQNIVSDVQEVSLSINEYNTTSVNTSINIVIDAIRDSSGSEPDRSNALVAAELIDDINDDVELALSTINNGVSSIQYNTTIDRVQEFETIRSWTVIGVFIAVGCVLLLICLVSMCMSKVCVSIMLVILSLMTAIVWIGTGAALASSIVIADMCHDPDNLIRNQTTDNTARELVDYFISCDATCRPGELNDTRNAIQRYRGAEEIVRVYIESEVPDVTDDVNVITSQFDMAQSIYNNVSSILTCSPSQGLRENYTSALNNFCSQGELFVVIILSLCGGLALSLFLLLCCLTCYDGLLINTSHEDEINSDDIVAFDTERTGNWSSSGRRLSYSEPYSNGGRYNGREEVRMSGLRGQSPPKYTDIGGRPGSGEYDHFDV